MEYLSQILAAVVAFLSPYWALLVFGLIVGVLLVILALVSWYVLPAMVNYMTSMADQIKSEKIRTRLHDAIRKFNIVANAILQQSSELTKEEFMTIIADGKVEADEVKAAASKYAEIAMKQLGPELETFKKYFVGNAVAEVFTGFFVQKMVSIVKAKLKAKAENNELTADTVAMDIPFQ